MYRYLRCPIANDPNCTCWSLDYVGNVSSTLAIGIDSKGHRLRGIRSVRGMRTTMIWPFHSFYDDDIMKMVALDDQVKHDIRSIDGMVLRPVLDKISIWAL